MSHHPHQGSHTKTWHKVAGNPQMSDSILPSPGYQVQGPSSPGYPQLCFRFEETLERQSIFHCYHMAKVWEKP